MEKPALNNPDDYPDDAVIKQHLGDAKTAWDQYAGILRNEYPQFTPEWRYYKDGHAWLCKVTKKKKTIHWIAVFQGYFKTTFYFTEKAADLIKNSNLKQEYIDQFITGKTYGKIKGVSVSVRQPSDLDMTRILIGIKEKLK